MNDIIRDAIADMVELRDDISAGIGWFCEEYDQLIDVSYPDANTIVIKLTDEADIAICPKCDEIYDKTKSCCEIP